MPIAGDGWVATSVDQETGEVAEDPIAPKAPAVMNGRGPRRFRWKHLQSAVMAEDDVRRFFAKAPRLGMVFGAVSGHAELVDFDEPGLYEEWRAVLLENGHEDLLARVAIQKSNRPGRYHVLYRCPEGVESNRKVAERPPTEEEIAADPKVQRVGLIETRGEGGYAVIAPSPGYEVLQGDLLALPVLSGDERRLLLDAAAYLDRMPPEEAIALETKLRARPSADLSPGDDFDLRGDWAEILEPHGWRAARKRGALTSWVRPGKSSKDGTSATTGLGHHGVEFMVCFSTNAHPLEPAPKKYGKFRAYAALSFAGSERERQSAAASALAKKGFGAPMRPSRVDAFDPVETNAPPKSNEPDAPAGGVFRRILWSELKARPPKVMLVENLLGEGDSAMLAGVRKGGKTAMAIDLALCMMGGLPFADGRFPVVRPLRVGYFTTEGLGAFHTRLEAANRVHQVSDLSLEENLWFFGQLPQLFDGAAEERIGQLVTELLAASARLDVIFLDTFAKSTLGAEENSNSEMSLALAALGKARGALGCASILVHHANKQGELRGASAIEGDLDVLVWGKWDEKKTGDRSLEFGFAKDLQPFDPVRFELRSVDHGVPGSLRVQWSSVQSGGGPGGVTALDQLLRTMWSEPDEAWTAAQLREATGLPANTIQTALSVTRGSRPGGPTVLLKPAGSGDITYMLAGRRVR